MIAFIIAAISLGFFSSFHCIGMCGPIALSLPVKNFNPLKRGLLIVIYNFGRLITYATFGYLFGSIGWSLALFSYQQVVSVAIGLLLLSALFLPSKYFLFTKISSLAIKIVNLKSVYRKVFAKGRIISFFLTGLLNGFLPCGLVYVALATSIALGNSLAGASFMFLFGLGTVPVMLSLPFIGNSISISFKSKLRKVVPYVTAATAILLLLRGLNLNIPYLSPQLVGNSENISCHQNKNTKRILCPVPERFKEDKRLIRAE